MTYTVRQPIAPGIPHEGIVISRHRSADAAHAAIAREQRRLRKQMGYGSSYVDRYVWDEDEHIVVTAWSTP